MTGALVIIELFSLGAFGLSQYTRLTDRQTDGQTESRQQCRAYASESRGKNGCGIGITGLTVSDNVRRFALRALYNFQIGYGGAAGQGQGTVAAAPPLPPSVAAHERLVMSFPLYNGEMWTLKVHMYIKRSCSESVRDVGSVQNGVIKKDRKNVDIRSALSIEKNTVQFIQTRSMYGACRMDQSSITQPWMVQFH